jgi:hypothetical protein
VNNYSVICKPINEIDEFLDNAVHFNEQFSRDLFFSLEFIKLQNIDISEGHCFFLIRESNNSIEGIGAFYLRHDASFNSPQRGSYGGLQIKKGSSFSKMNFFASEVINILKNYSRVKRRISIVLPPTSHDNHLVSNWNNIWKNLGFFEFNSELNFSINIDESIDFSSLLHSSVKKHIKRCKRESLICKRVDLLEIKEIYNVIKINREHRGFPVTMSLEAIEKTISCLNEKILLYGCYDSNHNLMASSIVYDINSDIDYVFYWGDLPNLNNGLSPISFLAEFIYNSSKDRKKKMLDLGTSTVNGVQNIGLITFKERLGACSSIKSYLKLN